MQWIFKLLCSKSLTNFPTASSIKYNFSTFEFKSLHNLVPYPSPVTYTTHSYHICIILDVLKSVFPKHFRRHYLFSSTTIPWRERNSSSSFFGRQHQDFEKWIQTGLLILNPVLLPMGSHHISCFDFLHRYINCFIWESYVLGKLWTSKRQEECPKIFL